MKTIERIKIRNFKRFSDIEVPFNPDVNLLIGDNEAGKSSILKAIELVLSGSRAKVESIGLESLFNVVAVTEFLSGDRKIEKLPSLYVELYLSPQDSPDLCGKNNSDNLNTDGLRLVCEPNEELTAEIKAVLEQDENNFPFEYYTIKFSTFSGEAYTGYRKFLRYLALDSSQINSEHATREYVKTVYESFVESPQRLGLRNEFRQQKLAFKEEQLKAVNDRLVDYQFAVRTGAKSCLETELTITEEEIPLEHRGQGRQCFIKTEFALQRFGEGQELDILLLEEPENHLSHTNMKKLVNRISQSEAKQIFISTHNSLISTRLNLRNSVLLNSSSLFPVRLNDLTEDTAKFFMKAPDNNILEFILSKKVVLVEGDAEYILFDALYQNVVGRTLEDDEVHVISVGGTSFKRYLELANLLGIKTAVIRDNDKDYQSTCIDGYKDYIGDNIKVFYETDNDKSTFEICLYEENKLLCGEMFGKSLKKNTPQGYMLANKAECAFRLRDEKADDIVVPEYMGQAVEWINE